MSVCVKNELILSNFYSLANYSLCIVFDQALQLFVSLNRAVPSQFLKPETSPLNDDLFLTRLCVHPVKFRPLKLWQMKNSYHLLKTLLILLSAV